MRFASFSLERYGRFEDCELTFRAGAPDLHVIYGANEAGKTTSLAAVSDLLFGFQPRSPYNFLFDYSLLRVGAVLEDENRTFACRRKKGSTCTLVDKDERPLDEGMLLAMLRGQTRETFGLSFSLNQDGLRAGGRAMMEARNDVGRALFAAGSGLTGVSDELTLLDTEADAIWGPRAAARRSFTQAQREFSDNIRLARDQALKPKVWLDAKAAVTTAEDALFDAERRRDEILFEARRAERIRRIAPSVQLRADHISALAEHIATVDIAPHRAEAAEAAMIEAGAAARDKSTAEQLAREASERMDAISAEPEVLARAEEIDTLITSSGAVDKARQDLSRLNSDQLVGDALIVRLREEAGDGSIVPPSRIISSRLREMAASHAQDSSALFQIRESEESLADRKAGVVNRPQPSEGSDEFKRLVIAVDAARALGADVDARCALAGRNTEVASAELDRAVARLAPWIGAVEALLILPIISQDEIDVARTALGDLATEGERDRQAADRATGEAATIALQMEQLASGAAVSPDEIAAARAERADRWRPLREHLLSDVPLPSVDDAVAAFEGTVAQADETSDLRFAAADESSRLALLDQRRAMLVLEAKQANGRVVSAQDSAQRARATWIDRLRMADYPELDPDRLGAWLTQRDVAETAHKAVLDTTADAAAASARRDEARAAIAAILTSHPNLPLGDQLGPLLAFAEQVKRELEQLEQQGRLDAAALIQIEQDLTDLRRRRQRLETAGEKRTLEWREALAETSLFLEIADAAAALDVLDELRVAIAAQAELWTRIEGMERDVKVHEEQTETLANSLDIAPRKEAAETLTALRARLAAARSAANVITALSETVDARTSEASAADARLDAARLAIEPLLEETGAPDALSLAAALERSRAARVLREAVSAVEASIVSDGDGYSLEELLAEVEGADTDSLAARSETLAGRLSELNIEVADAATARGDARRAFSSLEDEGGPAVDAATDAEQARAELGVLAEHYILKRAQAVTLRWAIERYRERHQDPMLLRASKLFSKLTIGRYSALRIDNDGSTPRLLGLRDDGRTVIEVGAMSEGTTDQLFLALRLAAVEQSVAAGVRLPFLADDLFVNFDDERSEAGFRVLAELARSTQVLFFTHHPHLANIARNVVGTSVHSECSLA